MTENENPIAAAIDEAEDVCDIPGPLPEIVVTRRHMRDISADSIAVLKEARTSNGTPLVYHRGTLVRLRLDQEGRVTAEHLTVPALRGTLDRQADYTAIGKDGERPARPPNDVCNDILVMAADDFPPLSGIARAPVFLSSGRILSDSGYDADSGMLIALDGLDSVRTDMPVDEAKELICDELLVDFPFVDDAGLTLACGAMIQPFVRQIIDGPTPLYLIDAPARGTGKGLLAEVIAIVTTGLPAAPMVLTRETDELEKRITAALLGDVGSILLDNVIRLAAAPLAAVLTTDFWSGRLLGKSELVRVPNRLLWLATGNNVSLSDEMVRRVVSIRLDAGVARPEERAVFKHRDLRAWTLGHRTQLVSACLSLVEHWRREGSPAPSDGATLGRYESWCSVIGGILETTGLPGFLSGRERLHEQADRESQEWGTFCASWWDAHANHPVTAKDIFAIAKSRGTLLDIWSGRSELSAMQRFGHALQAKRNRIFGDYMILPAGNDSQTGNAAYRLDKRDRLQTPETPEISQVSCRTDATSQDESGVSGVSGVCFEAGDHNADGDSGSAREFLECGFLSMLGAEHSVVKVRWRLLDEDVILAADHAQIPSDNDLVVYREAELRELVGKTPEQLRKIHDTKKMIDGEI